MELSILAIKPYQVHESEKTRIKLTAEYLDTPSMDAAKYDTRTKEGLQQLIADYAKKQKIIVL